MGEAYKVELVDAIPDGQDLKIYRQGDWFDLCRGPHMAATGRIGTAFKLMKVPGAYWRGDADKPMLSASTAPPGPTSRTLTPICTCWRRRKSATTAASAARWTCSTSRRKGRASSSGTPRAGGCSRTLLSYMRRRIEDDYDEVNAPQVLDRSLWQTSGHWGWYRENMFAVTCADEEAEDTRVFALKPMNCPGHVQIFKHGLKSYRELPIRLAEFGNVHRYEPSGALHGLMRVRGFTQDDAHVFCTEEQLEEEILKINDLMMSVYQDFGFEEVVVKLATRPEKRVGTDECGITPKTS
jgi:threonyl-tRNA synthetase